MRTYTRDRQGRAGQGGRPTSARHARRRRGYTLVESLVALTLLSVTLTTVTLTLHTLYKADRRLRDELDRESELQRLAAQFRTDTHTAETATVGPLTNDGSAKNRLDLTLGTGRKVQYSVFPERIERTLHQAETVEHRESYRLPPSASATWQVQENRSPPMVALAVEFRSGDRAGEQAVSSVVRINAALRLLNSAVTSPQD